MSVFDVRRRVSYLDNAATTEMAPEVVAEMQPYLEERYGNAGTLYPLGREARAAVEQARERVALLMGADPAEVFFTSGGTEANNWAVKSGFPKKTFVACSSVEHSSVLESVRWMGRSGMMPGGVMEIPVDEEGRIRLDALNGGLMNKLGKYRVGLVSVQFGNNEIGTLQPVREAAELCKASGSVFHCDAVQAYGRTTVDVKELGVDLMTVSGHKIHGPMGVGALYIRKGVELEPFIHGGGHEGGMRAGTVAVAQVVGFGAAAALARETLKTDEERMRRYVESVAGELGQKMGAVRNGSPKSRLPHILSVTIPGSEGPLVAGILGDVHGCCIGTGSACHARRGGSHVLEAMGRPQGDSGSTLRISLSRYTTRDELTLFVALLQKSVAESARRSVL